MKVKVNFKKPTVLLTADKYSSLLEEMASLRRGLDQYKSWCENMYVSLTNAREQVDALHGAVARKDAEVVERNALIKELNDQIAASESALDDAHGDLVFQEGLQKDCEAYITELKFQVNMLTKRLEESESKRDHNATLYETATRAATELADMLVRANAEADKARAETEDIKLELMDREFRIDELEKQVEWLRENESNYQNLLAENTELISKNMDLKRAFNETYEKEADFCAEAQFERERADQLEEANKNLYAQVLAQRDTIERLQCQRAADEEDYNTLKGMYDELHMAAQDLVTHIRK